MSRKVGMIGQIVLDTIYRFEDDVTRDLGGLVYSIMAMDAVMEPDDKIYPMTRLGQDAIEDVTEALRTVSRVSLDGIIADGHQNNRVELRYIDAETREERVAGGVDPMGIEDLLHIDKFDGLLINLVSGREIEARVLREIKGGIPLPVHLDLHSYLIDYDEGGTHYWRRPDDWDEWLDLCDILQVNRDELYTIAGHEGEIFDTGGEVWKMCERRRTSCLVVTDGEKGSWAWYSDEDAKERNCYVPPLAGLSVVDPTGSGDVYGSSFFLSRLKGESMERSMIHATRIAGFNCTRSGTRRLNEYLRERENQTREEEGSGRRNGEVRP